MTKRQIFICAGTLLLAFTLLFSTACTIAMGINEPEDRENAIPEEESKGESLKTEHSDEWWATVEEYLLQCCDNTFETNIKEYSKNNSDIFTAEEIDRLRAERKRRADSGYVFDKEFDLEPWTEMNKKIAVLQPIGQKEYKKAAMKVVSDYYGKTVPDFDDIKVSSNDEKHVLTEEGNKFFNTVIDLLVYSDKLDYEKQIKPLVGYYFTTIRLCADDYVSLILSRPDAFDVYWRCWTILADDMDFFKELGETIPYFYHTEDYIYGGLHYGDKEEARAIFEAMYGNGKS